MQYNQGDRVLVLKHNGWEQDAVGTVSSAARPRVLPDGSTDYWYWVDFDQPQKDLSDEQFGKGEMRWEASLVLGRFMRRLEGGAA